MEGDVIMVGSSRRNRNGNQNQNTFILRSSSGNSGPGEDWISMELWISIDGRNAREFRADVYLYGRPAREALRVAYSMLSQASEGYLSPADRDVLDPKRAAAARNQIEYLRQNQTVDNVPTQLDFFQMREACVALCVVTHVKSYW